MDYLIYIWEKHLSLYLGNIWESLFFWRSVSLVAITIIIVFIIFRKKIKEFFLKNDHLLHDKTIFKKLDECISERDLIDLFYRLQSEDGLDENSIDKIGEILSISEEEGNKYINKKLAKKSEEFIYYLNKLNDFMVIHFFPHKNIESWYTLEPELKKDTDYKKFRDELDNKINITRKKYKNYRLTVREIINI